MHLLLAYGQQSSHRAGTAPEHHEIRPQILAAGRWPTRCAAHSRFPGSTPVRLAPSVVPAAAGTTVLVLSTVMGTAGTTGVFWGEEGGGLGKLEPGPRFSRGAGAVPGSPSHTRHRSPLLHFERSGAGVILTLASRSGGEVRITEAQRPDASTQAGRVPGPANCAQ